MPALESPMKCLRLCRVIVPRLPRAGSSARGKSCAPGRARQAWIGAPTLCAYRESERQCDLMKEMMAEIAGPSCLKKPCAPAALQGFELGAPVVVIHWIRALPPDQATKRDASPGGVRRQASWL